MSSDESEYDEGEIKLTHTVMNTNYTDSEVSDEWDDTVAFNTIGHSSLSDYEVRWNENKSDNKWLISVRTCIT